MSEDQIRALFPVKATLTAEIIENSTLNEFNECRGANTLKTVIPNELHSGIAWWNFTGSILYNDRIYSIATEEKLPFMQTSLPTTVTFILTR